MSHTQKHRHFVALPIAVLGMTLVIGLHAVLPATSVRADVTSHIGDVLHGPRDVLMPSGTHLFLDAGTDVSVATDGVSFRLKQGSVLVSVQGYAELFVGCASVQSLRGLFFVSVSDSHLTIASVKGPLLVRPCSTAPRIIADAMQMIATQDGSTSAVLPVDQSWIIQQVKRSEQVVDVPVSLSSMSTPTLTPLDRSHALALLLRSPLTTSADDVEHAFSVTEAIDAEGLLRILLALTLTRSSVHFDAPTEHRLVSALSSSSSLSSDVVEGIPRMLLQVPMALPESLHAFWLDQAFRVSVADPQRMLVLLQDMSHLPAMFDAHALPKQSEFWRKHVTDISRLLDPLLSSADRQTLSLVQSTLVSTDTASDQNITHTEASVSSSKPVQVSSAEMVYLAREMLLQYGVLFTSDTRIDTDPRDDQSVRMTGIFLSDHGRDTAYELSYSPSHNLLHSIIRDGVSLPNALTPEQFFRSMKKASE